MDRYDTLLNLIESPESFSSDEICSLLSDMETEKLYKLLCQTASAMNSNDAVSYEDIDREWERLITRKPEPHYNMRTVMHCFRPSSRAASVSTIILTSLGALALGIAVTLSVVEIKPKKIYSDEQTAMNVQALEEVERKPQPEKIQSGEATPVIFENVSLMEILKFVSEQYGVTVEFRNPETADIHLFYKLDSCLPLEEIIEQLNTFERIDIYFEDNSLIVG